MVFLAVLFLALFLGAVLYMLPWIVSLVVDSTDKAGLFVFNLLAGWTVIGWAFALIWAVESPRRGAPAPSPVVQGEVLRSEPSVV